MIERIAPQFFSADMPATLAYYAENLGCAACCSPVSSAICAMACGNSW